MRMRIVLASVLFALLAIPAPAQESQDEKVEKILKRIDDAIRTEMERVRKEVGEMVRKELSSRTPQEKVEPKNAGKGLELITVDLLKGHGMTLASDDYAGRNAGYEGNDKAAEYIADVFKKAGLKPIGDEGTYLQHFEFTSFYTGNRKLKTQNVVGLLEGTDPKLKKEIVVVGAHFDHVGKDGEGRHLGRMGRATEDDGIWNGADDNGSGTTCVLGLAKAFGEGGIKTKRSILFICFSAEEAGLYGSQHYCDHPYGSIMDHVFMLNLDMVGRNPDKAVQIKGVGSAENGVIKKVIDEAVAETGLKAKLEEGSDIFGGDSDHSSFKAKKVPFSFFFTDFHADYHRPSDHPEKLAYENMVKISKTSGLILQKIANADERPVFKGRGGRQLNFGGDEETPAKPARLLGISGDELGAEDCDDLGIEGGGLKVGSVNKGSVAEAAGLQSGDVILSLGGKALGRETPRQDLLDLMAEVEANTPVEILVLRGGKKVTLKATWAK